MKLNSKPRLPISTAMVVAVLSGTALAGGNTTGATGGAAGGTTSPTTPGTAGATGAEGTGVPGTGTVETITPSGTGSAAAAAHAAIWKRYDTDKDGNLSKEEASKIPDFNFEDADVNKDGKISEFEFSTRQSDTRSKGDPGK